MPCPWHAETLDKKESGELKEGPVTERRIAPMEVTDSSGRDPNEKGKKALSAPIRSNFVWVYRCAMMGTWLVVSAVMILDRFYWNAWPRQNICTNGCGEDFFCDMDKDPGCLKDGPWSVQVFDVIARISSRLIISTTSLLFATMCHSTWNRLSEVPILRPFLYRWRDDNLWLHTVGGWTIGVWVVAHVWSLILPSMVHGFQNVTVGGPISWPLQVGLPGGNLDVSSGLARWGVDDIWRIFWMTVIFGALMPLSRSAWALRKNYSLAMWLHMALGAGFFFDSWRRRTHPHVWILNTPVVLWYLVDKIWCSTRGRVDASVEATRIVLDADYMLLLWKSKIGAPPKRICDIFWLKRNRRPEDDAMRMGEMSHPFTTCSSHDVVVHTPLGRSGDASDVRPTIEPPIKTDVSWPGHRFSLGTRRSRSHSQQPSAESTSLSATLAKKLSTVSEARTGRGSTVDGSTCSSGSDRGTNATAPDPGNGSKTGAGDMAEEAGEMPSRWIDTHGTLGPKNPSSHESPSARAVGDASSPGSGSGSSSSSSSGSRTRRPRTFRAGDTIMGVDAGGSFDDDDGEISVILGNFDDWATPSRETNPSTGQRLVSMSARSYFEESEGQINSADATDGPSVYVTPGRCRGSSSIFSPDITPRSARGTLLTPPGSGFAQHQHQHLHLQRRGVIKRLPTQEFQEFREKEAKTGALAPVGEWDKMAIVRIHRRLAPKARECSCMGFTHVITSFRRTETVNMAGPDLEEAQGAGDMGNGGRVPLRTCGPYRSEYGRLSEFPNLPPLLIIATGAGAALALDFVGFVRANKLVPARPVTVCYSSASLALLQFVTNTLLAERTPGIHIKTALTRHDDLELSDTMVEPKGDLAIGRLDVASIVNVVSSDTEVYFCGGGGVNKLLRQICSTRGMKYAGSSVQ